MSGTLTPPVGAPPLPVGTSQLAAGTPSLNGLGTDQLSAVGIPTAKGTLNPLDLYTMALGHQILNSPTALHNLFTPRDLTPGEMSPNGSGGGEGGGEGGGGAP